MLSRLYSWRHSHGGVSAQAAGEMIEKIEARDGVVTKEAFLEESRPEDSPTHGCFEWDDGIAAEKYRLWQSGSVIRDVCITVVSDDDKAPIKTPVFVNTVKNCTAPAKFMSVEVALADETHRNTILENAFSELQEFRKKYGRLKELAEVFKVIDKVIEEGGKDV